MEISDGQLAAVILTVKAFDPGVNIERAELMVNGVAVRGLDATSNHLLLSPGKHRMVLVQPHAKISNEIEFEARSGESIAVEIHKQMKQPEILLLKFAESNSEEVRRHRWQPKTLAFLILLCMAGLALSWGVVNIARYSLDPIYQSFLSQKPPSKVATVFWRELLLHGGLTPSSQLLLSPDLDTHVRIDWTQIAEQIMSATGPNRSVSVLSRILTAEDRVVIPAYATVAIKVSGGTDAVHIITYVTRISQNAEWTVAGFDIIRLEPDVHNYSGHLLDHLPPNKIVTVGKRIYKQ
jgi:hypothetical protein